MDKKIIHVEDAISQCRICNPSVGPYASLFNKSDDKHGMLLVVNHPDDINHVALNAALNSVFGLDWENELDITFWLRCPDISDEAAGRLACAVYTKNMMRFYRIVVLLDHPDYEINKAKKVETNRYVINIKDILQKGASISDWNDARTIINEVQDD